MSISPIIIVAISLTYLALLFAVGYWAEKRKSSGRSWIDNPFAYALSLMVFCTAWTFFGSVGQASQDGMMYMTTYLGPLLVAPLMGVVIRKMIRISRNQNITSIADFISSRYGKNFSLGIIITLLCVLGIVPYIAIQLKAIASSIALLSGQGNSGLPSIYITFAVTIALGVFVILFGTRSVASTERHEGMVAAIAFESIVKLVAFAFIGLFVLYVIHDGWSDVFNQVALPEALIRLPDNGYFRFFILTILSAFAFILLPRQFHVMVIENTSEKNLQKTSWIIPLYLLIITVFVAPIAITGLNMFSPDQSNADTFVLAIPMALDKPMLSLLIYIGGLSASTSMIIVETIALSTMISNHIVIPGILTRKNLDNSVLPRTIIRVRRLAILAILLLALVFEQLIATRFPLVSVGLISFSAVAQFAPSLFAGLYWKGASRVGAISGIATGFVLWFYTLVVPAFCNAGLMPMSILLDGPFSIEILRPDYLFGLNISDHIVHGFVWSMLANTFVFYTVSLYTNRSEVELVQAQNFVEVFNISRSAEEEIRWKGVAYVKDLVDLLGRFFGSERAQQFIQNYAQRNSIQLSQKNADPRLVSFSERVLSGAIGSASAHIMVQSVVQEEKLSMNEVLQMLQETRQTRSLNRELQRKQDQLEQTTSQLQKVNEQLTQLDAAKDEFLYTVTHELRTPLTSIRALAEIVHDNPELDEDERSHYLSGIVKEAERLSHLITQVLHLEKYESGKQKIYLNAVDFNSVVNEVLEAVKPLLQEKLTALEVVRPDSQIMIQCDKSLLVQVLYNLVTNAIKFAHPSSGRIVIRLLSDDTELITSVEDNGKGIDPELHDLIFDKFFQAKNQTLRKPEGSGLGLAICKRIVEMHSGRIFVKNKQQGGAVFTFVLPLKTASHE